MQKKVDWIVPLWDYPVIAATDTTSTRHIWGMVGAKGYHRSGAQIKAWQQHRNMRRSGHKSSGTLARDKEILFVYLLSNRWHKQLQASVDKTNRQRVKSGMFKVARYVIVRIDG